MKTQLDFLKEIVKLKEENPDLEVKFLAEMSEEHDCGFEEREIVFVRLSDYGAYSGFIYDDIDDLAEVLYDEVFDEMKDTPYLLTETAMERFTKEKAEELMKKVILVYFKQ